VHYKKTGSLLGQIILIYCNLHRIFRLEECITPNTCSKVSGSRKSRGKFGDFPGTFLGFSRVSVLGNEITFDNIIIHNAKIEKSTHAENGQPRVSPPPIRVCRTPSFRSAVPAA
jgi:hypothetical protein